MIKAIIFDFDGVIVESTSIKTKAFCEMYKPYGIDVVRKVKKHHVQNQGMNRHEKFKIYHSDFLETIITEKEIERLADKFSDLVMEKVTKASYVKGAYEFLSNNHTKYDIFLSSGTPEKELIMILTAKEIIDYFKGVFGSPKTKTSHVKKIITLHNYEFDEVLYIGDSITDKIAADNNKIHFVGRTHKDSHNFDENDICIHDISYVESVLSLFNDE